MAESIRDAVNDFIKNWYSTLLEEEISSFVSLHGGMRNGYYKRHLETAYGRFALSIPRTREKGFFPSFLKKYRRQDESLLVNIIKVLKRTATLPESIREIDDNYNILYSDTFLRSLRSTRVKAREDFESRKINEEYEAVFLDGTYIHIDGDKYCLMFLVGLDAEGKKTVLDFELSETENRESYRKMLQALKDRGLKKVKLLVSDGFCDTDELAGDIFPQSLPQRCLVHFGRNVRNLAKDGVDGGFIYPFIDEVGEIVKSDMDFENSRIALNEAIKNNTVIASIMKISGNSLNFLINHKRLDRKFWKATRTTNIIEGFNHHLKKRLRYREQFKTRESLVEFVSSFILKS